MGDRIVSEETDAPAIGRQGAERSDSEKKVASSEMLPPLYEELRKLAMRKMANEPAGQTISATVLVHEAYLKITKSQEDARWDNRGHF